MTDKDAELIAELNGCEKVLVGYYPAGAKALRQAASALSAQAQEIEKYKTALRRTGVCMTCVFGHSDPMGCTDCLNTGWDGGAPVGYVEESRFIKQKQEIEELKYKIETSFFAPSETAVIQSRARREAIEQAAQALDKRAEVYAKAAKAFSDKSLDGRHDEHARDCEIKASELSASAAIVRSLFRQPGADK